MADDEGYEQVALLGDALGHAAFRRAFSEDPLAAMTTSNIDASKIPQDIVEALAELTPAELRVLSQIKDVLQKDGLLPSGIIAHMV